MEAPATPTMDFRGTDDSATFELFDGSSASQNRKRRRSSLRRVSFAEQPSIHVFARDDDYETPPEGTMSHLSAQSTPTSDSRSPQRRSERLSAARGGRCDESEVDKENAPTSVGSISRQRKRGRRPLAVRNTQKEKEEEFLKPSNWLDDREDSAFGSCDENTGPVDLRHITIGDQNMAVEDDDNMTMDSQTFHTRISQMLAKQPLHCLSEGRETGTITPGFYTDMDLTVMPPVKQAQEGEGRVLDEPTWHKGDGDLSDMSLGSFEEHSILRVLAKKRASRKELSICDTDNTIEGGVSWTEDDAQSQERTLSMQIVKPETQHTSVPVKSSGSAKSFIWEEDEQGMDMSDMDMTERYQEGITEAMPKLTFVLGGYSCDSPSVEPLDRIFQRKSDIDAEDSPVYGLTAEIDIQKEKPSRKDDDIAQTIAAEEKEAVSHRDLEEDTEEVLSETGKLRNVFQNPEDTFSFKRHQKSIRETSPSKSMEQERDFPHGDRMQNVIPRPTFSDVQVDAIESNLSKQSVPQSSGQALSDKDATADFTDQHNWRAEVSSDMSTTPLSPKRPKHFQRVFNKARPLPMQSDMGWTDSPSFPDDITAAVPNVQDLLAADVGTPESELGRNPRKIVWSTQHFNDKVLEDEGVLRQPGIDQMEDTTTHSMAEKICTPRGLEEKKHMFEFMSEEAAKTLNQVSHSKEVRNSVASKMLLRMMSLQDNGCAQAEFSSDSESQQILGRALHFQLESENQVQSQALRGDAEQQINVRDPNGTMGVESVKNVDEINDLNDSRIESHQQESRRQKLLQEMQVAQEKLLVLERHSENLRKRAEDCHQAIAKRCRSDTCFEMKEMAAFCSHADFSKLKKRFQLLNCMQLWDLKTTKIGDYEVLHEFNYWALCTHSVYERKKNNVEFTVSKSSIDLNEASINQVYGHMNASLAWRWFLLGHEEIVQIQGMVHHVQGVHSKVIILLDLMEEVHNCRKYLVIPHFQLQTGSSLRLNLQFSDSGLLFDFVLSFDMRQVTHMRYSRSHDLDGVAEMNQKLDCAVQIESAGRFFGKKITEAEIKRAVNSVVAGHEYLLRICTCVNKVILDMRK